MPGEGKAPCFSGWGGAQESERKEGEVVRGCFVLYSESIRVCKLGYGDQITSADCIPDLLTGCHAQHRRVRAYQVRCEGRAEREQLGFLRRHEDVCWD